MLPTQKVVKKTALTAMKNKWPGAVAAASIFVFFCLLNALINELTNFATNLFIANLVSAFCFIFIAFPLFLGVVGYFRALAFGENVSVMYVFYPFSSRKNYFRALTFSVSLILRIFVVSFVLLFPSLLARVLSLNTTYNAFGVSMPVWAPGLSVVSVLLCIAGAVVTVAVILKYYAAPFLFVANENLTAGEVIKLTRKITSGRRLDFCFLSLSLTGWIILSVFIMPLVFTAPYFFMIYVVHCRFCVAAYNKAVSIPQNGTPTFNPYF